MATVLIVCRDPRRRKKLARELKTLGLTVRLGIDPKAGLDLVRSEGVDLLVADVFPTSRPSGLDLARALRTRSRPIEVILLGGGARRYAGRCETLGVWGFPELLNLPLLRTCVRKILEGRLQKRSARLPAEGGRPAVPEVPGEVHEVDDLWFEVFSRLGPAGRKGVRRKKN